MRVLLIHASPQIVKAALEGDGIVVETARSADANLHSDRYDVIVLDAGLPRANAIACVKRWRHENAQVHLIVLASRLSQQARVKLLNAGADCYLLKPDHLDELRARVRALARRSSSNRATEDVLRVFDLEIDTTCRMVRRGGRAIALTPREYALLRYLALNRGQVVTRAMILEHVYQGREESNVINVYIRYLRNKIDKGFDCPLILTRYGSGYMLRSESAQGPHGTSPLTMAG